MKSLIREIHRRSMWQVLGIYLAGSWLAFQAVQTLTEGLGLPDWVPPLALVLLIVGLPIVVATAFVQEGMGSRRTDTASPGPSQEPSEAVSEGPARSPEGSPVAHDPPPSPAPPGEPHEPTMEGARHRLFTWRNALLGGAAAFALLGVGTAAYMSMRTLGIGPVGSLVASGVLQERERVVLANFASRTQDSLLAGAVTEALRVDLSQSRLVRLTEPAYLKEALARMQRRPDSRLDLELARELAIREGIRAVVGGEINAAGNSYVISARMIAASSGEELAAYRETTRDTTAIIPAVDKLSKKLRERIGESLRSIRAEPPLERATTGNLDALRKYSQAWRALEAEGDRERGIALLEEAVALDTAFAMAYRKLGVTLANAGQEAARALEAFARAFQHRDRLTERERYLTEGSYYTQGVWDAEKAVTAYRNLLDLEPDNYAANNNLGVVLEFLRDDARAEERYLLAFQADSSEALSLRNAARVQAVRGNFGAADASARQLVELFPDNPMTPELEGFLGAMRGDFETAETAFRDLGERHATSAYWRAEAIRSLFATAAATARLAQARSRLLEALEVHADRDVPGEYLARAADLVFLDEVARRDPSRSLEMLEEALRRYPLDELEPLDRPYVWLAAAFATAGSTDRSRRLLDAYAEEVPPELQRGDAEGRLNWTRGQLALAEARYEDAIGEFRSADIGWCRVCALEGLGRAYDLAGQPDSALAAYERYLATHDSFRLRETDWRRLGPTYERTAQLYDEKTDFENAARYYAMFVELWAEADEELQPRVRAAQARLEEILRDRG
jgi:tetratricopeptide (TPR) repeat protein